MYLAIRTVLDQGERSLAFLESARETIERRILSSRTQHLLTGDFILSVGQPASV